MTVTGVDGLRQALGALSLDTRGHKAQLKKRLRLASKKNQAASVAGAAIAQAQNSAKAGLRCRPAGQDFDSYLVLDFEATCQRHELRHGHFLGFPNEIIEFPVLLLQWHQKPQQNRYAQPRSPLSLWANTDNVPFTSMNLYAHKGKDSKPSKDIDQSDHEWELAVTGEFRCFVKPTWRPILSSFCTELTGITQAEIDAADHFKDVLDDFISGFAKEHDLFSRTNKTTWVTDGPWDLRDFVAKQCYISQIVRPPWLRGPYIDLRTSATAYISQCGIISSGSLPSQGRKRAPAVANISSVLAALDLEPFRGRIHSGIDDVRNLARILQDLVRPERSWTVRANAFIYGKDRRWEWMGKAGEVAWYHTSE